MTGNIKRDEEDLTDRYCVPINSLTAPIEVGDIGYTRAGTSAFFAWPPFGPLLFENETSDARDHCANERTFLSYFKLSIYMALASVVITLSLHIKRAPSDLELRMAKPVGVVFWVLSVMTLLLGIGNYIRTVNQYSQKTAIVQAGWKTQLSLGILATCIVATCLILRAMSLNSGIDSDAVTMWGII